MTEREERLTNLSSKNRVTSARLRKSWAGKVLVTGLSTSAVLGLTAAFGASTPSFDAAPDQVIFDETTGVLMVIRNGKVVSAQKVTSSADPALVTSESAEQASVPANESTFAELTTASSKSSESSTSLQESAIGPTPGNGWVEPSNVASPPPETVLATPEVVDPSPTEQVIVIPEPVQTVTIPIPAAPIELNFSLPPSGSSSGS